MCCGNSILQKGLPFFYLHKIFYTLKILEIFHTSNYIVKEETENEEVVFFIVIVILNILRL